MIVDLPLCRLCASISPATDSVGCQHTEVEVYKNHRAAIVTVAGVTGGGVHRIPELLRNRAESAWHSEMSGAQQACSLQTVVMELQLRHTIAM